MRYAGPAEAPPRERPRAVARHEARRRVAALVLLAVACTALWGCGGAGPSHRAGGASAQTAGVRSNAVTVSPLPGAPDASPTTQISFLGGAATRVLDVSVSGSRTGRHTGALKRYATGTGASFLPRRPFQPGESVSVSALVGIGPGAPVKQVRTTFTIGRQAAVSRAPFVKEPGNPGAVQRYATMPGAAPSTITITTPAKPGAAPGYLFVAPYQGDGTPGPMIVRQDGTLVWFHPVAAGEDATNFQVQRYRGRPVLTWWQGHILRVGFGQGEDVVYDSSYRRIATIRAGNGYLADLHEIRLTAQGTAWIDAFEEIHMDQSSVGGSRDGVIEDCVVQEIDVKTGLVMWEWHALGHIPLRDSQSSAPSGADPWDYAHVNSIDPGEAGDVLLSARNTWAMYDIDVHTGAPRWQLGGSDSTFKLGQGARTYWQHDAEWQPGGLISAFDNGDAPAEEKQSRGVLLRPDEASGAATLVKAFVNPTGVLRAPAQGSTLALPGGDWLMGYGNLPNFTEYDASGQVLLDGTLGPDVQDFRTYLSPWSGRPSTRPAILAKRSGASVTVQTSWNGATDVASWQLLAGGSPASLSPVARTAQTGFQSTLKAVTGAGYAATRALAANGRVLGASVTVRVG